MKKSNLFSEFEPTNTKAWKQKIQADLKGADYNETLIWQSPEGINVKPFYNNDDLLNINLPINTSENWCIGDTIFVNNEAQSNNTAKNYLNDGIETISFIIPNNTIDLNRLLNNLDQFNIELELLFIDASYCEKYKTIINDKKASIHIDCIHQLVSDGNWYSSKENDFASLSNIIKENKTLTVNGKTYQNSGANITQQVAYTLSHLNEYFNIIENTAHLKSLFKKETLNINIQTSIGSNYFFEIAKLRALKLLINSLNDDYQFNIKINISATPTERNKTIYDYNTNMLRTTTECMSAILGNANTIFNLSYDSIYHKTNTFGKRISKNQLLILKHESYFNDTNNPSDGSYYIESLTYSIAENALTIFKDIETNGGFIDALYKGTIQKKIKESANKEQDLFNAKQIVLVGSNKFINPNDVMKDNLELYPFIKHNPRKTQIEPCITKRLSEQNEQERLKKE